MRGRYASGGIRNAFLRRQICKRRYKECLVFVVSFRTLSVYNRSLPIISEVPGDSVFHFGNNRTHFTPFWEPHICVPRYVIKVNVKLHVVMYPQKMMPLKI